MLDMTISFTDSFTLSAWPLGRCRSLTPVEVPSQVWQDGVAMNDSENQFSITRVVPSTSGRAKTKFLTVIVLGRPVSPSQRRAFRRAGWSFRFFRANAGF